MIACYVEDTSSFVQSTEKEVLQISFAEYVGFISNSSNLLMRIL